MIQISKLEIDKDTCEVVLRWNHPTVDSHLIIDYIVMRFSVHNYNWFLEEMVSVGIDTQYTTKCTLQPGRLYDFYIYQNVSLTDPDETIFLYSTGRSIIIGMGFFSCSYIFYTLKSY